MHIIQILITCFVLYFIWGYYQGSILKEIAHVTIVPNVDELKSLYDSVIVC